MEDMKIDDGNDYVYFFQPSILLFYNNYEVVLSDNKRKEIILC